MRAQLGDGAGGVFFDEVSLTALARLPLHEVADLGRSDRNRSRRVSGPEYPLFVPKFMMNTISLTSS